MVNRTTGTRMAARHCAAAVNSPASTRSTFGSRAYEDFIGWGLGITRNRLRPDGSAGRARIHRTQVYHDLPAGQYTVALAAQLTGTAPASAAGHRHADGEAVPIGHRFPARILPSRSQRVCWAAAKALHSRSIMMRRLSRQ